MSMAAVDVAKMTLGASNDCVQSDQGSNTQW